MLWYDFASKKPAASISRAICNNESGVNSGSVSSHFCSLEDEQFLIA